MKEEYVIWSDGVLTSMGVLVDRLENGKLSVKNPVTIVFSMEQQPIAGTENDADGPKFRSVLRFDMTPYIFGVCLDEGSSVWEISPLHALSKGSVNNQLIDAYKNTVRVTSVSPAKK